MITAHELKAQLRFLGQGWFILLDIGILSLAGGPGGAPQADKEDAKGSGPPMSRGTCHLHVPNIRLCHPLVGYVPSFTILSVMSCPSISEEH